MAIVKKTLKKHWYQWFKFEEKNIDGNSYIANKPSKTMDHCIALKRWPLLRSNMMHTSWDHLMQWHIQCQRWNVNARRKTNASNVFGWRPVFGGARKQGTIRPKMPHSSPHVSRAPRVSPDPYIMRPPYYVRAFTNSGRDASVTSCQRSMCKWFNQPGQMWGSQLKCESSKGQHGIAMPQQRDSRSDTLVLFARLWCDARQVLSGPACWHNSVRIVHLHIFTDMTLLCWSESWNWMKIPIIVKLGPSSFNEVIADTFHSMEPFHLNFN